MAFADNLSVIWILLMLGFFRGICLGLGLVDRPIRMVGG